MKTVYTILLSVIPILFFSNSARKSAAEIKFNEIQVIGSHNSYKIAIEKPLFDYLLESKPTMSGLEYEHIPFSLPYSFDSWLNGEAKTASLAVPTLTKTNRL